MDQFVLADIQKMDRERLDKALAAIVEEFDKDDPSDDVLDRFEALHARDDELTTIAAQAGVVRQERLNSARSTIQVMRKAVVTDPAVRPEVATDELNAAFDNYLRTGRPSADLYGLEAEQSPRDRVVPGIRAAQGEGTGSAGGYTVPDEMAMRMTERMKAFGGVMRVAEIMTTTDGRNYHWPSLDDTSNEGEVVAEGAAAASGADLVFDKKEIGAYRFDSVGASGSPLRVSRELLTDSAFDIQGLIERKLPQRIMRHASGKFVNGTGANEPQGLVYGLTGIEPAADTTTPTYADIITWMNSIDQAYLDMGNCTWLMNQASWALFVGMLDSNTDPLWRSDMIGAISINPPSLFNFPVVIDNSFLDFDVDNNTQNWGAFGDISEGFVIRMVSSPAILVDPFTRISQNEIQFVANQRMDSIRNDTYAFVALTGEQ